MDELSAPRYTRLMIVLLDLFLHALLLDRILGLEKITRTHRVHLVYSFDTLVLFSVNVLQTQWKIHLI